MRLVGGLIFGGETRGGGDAVPDAFCGSELEEALGAVSPEAKTTHV